MRILRTGLLLTMIVVPLSSGNAAEKVDQFAAAYARAKTEVEKRSVCIDVIDAGVVRMGVSVDVVKKVFGSDFEEFGADSHSNRLARVNFIPPLRSTNRLVSDVYRGWYLAITYRPDGPILSYHLTNEGKESAMAAPPEKGDARKQDIGLPIPSVTPDNSKKKK